VRNTLLISAAAVAGASLVAAPAFAADTATSDSRALILLPLSLTKVQDLSFGTVVPPSSGPGGTVTILATNGNRSHTGAVVEVGSDTGDRALFAWAGTQGQQVDFSISSAPANLTSGANSVAVSLLYLSTTSTIVGSTGVVEVGVGGSISIPANQPAGLYTGTFDVTADYN
jgi:hypothetical protein